MPGALYRKHDGVPDGSHGDESAGDGDSNDTAVALMALEESGVHTVATDAAEAAALTYFATQQVDDGGFAYSTAWGATSDADSDATSNFVDLDADGDGIPDAAEGSVDLDNDRVPNNLDTDADGDGMLDSFEGTGDWEDDGRAPIFL